MTDELDAHHLHPHEGSEVVLSDGRVGTVAAEPSDSGETPIMVLLPDVGTVHVSPAQIAEVHDQHTT